MKLPEFLSRLKGMGDRINKSSVKALYITESFVLRELRKHSPVDTGFFASQWRARRIRFAGNRGVIGGLVISNKAGYYGQFLELGAAPGGAPWYFPNTRKPTGKLKVSGGRVWAGGLDPGHSLTVGGAISNVIQDKALLKKVTRDISNEVIKAVL